MLDSSLTVPRQALPFRCVREAMTLHACLNASSEYMLNGLCRKSIASLRNCQLTFTKVVLPLPRNPDTRVHEMRREPNCVLFLRARVSKPMLISLPSSAVAMACSIALIPDRDGDISFYAASGFRIRCRASAITLVSAWSCSGFLLLAARSSHVSMEQLDGGKFQGHVEY